MCLRLWLLAGFSLSLVAASNSGQLRREEIQSLLRDTDVNGFASNDDDFEVEFVYTKAASEGTRSSRDPPLIPVTRRWGIPDSDAFVGKLFSLPIPSDAFEGNVSSYEFHLPPWLSYSRSSGVIEGVPFGEDVGTVYVSAKAIGEDGSTARDTFAIHTTNIPASVMLKEAKCFHKKDVSVLSLVLEKPSSPLLPRDKVQLITAVSRVLNGAVSANEISLVASPSVDPFDEDFVTMSGPGSYKARSSYHHSAMADSSIDQLLLQWPVGCDGQIKKGLESMVKLVKELSLSGKLESALRIPLVGWMVAPRSPSTKRVTRDVEYSGDDYDGSDYDDYDDYDELFNKFPVIPSLATPILPDTPATIHVDRAHVSPVFKAVPLSTPVHVPVKPTRVVEAASPTLATKTDYPFGPLDPDLESSLLTHPTTSADYTTPLTMTSSVFTKATSRESGPTIKATAVPTESEVTEIGVKNFPPRVRNRIQKMAWIAGSVYRIQIPEDSFIDTEDGGTRNLALVLKNEMGEVFSRNSWIQFDPSKQEVYALPLENHIGTYHFRLEAMDKDRKMVSDLLDISVRQHTQARLFHHQFTAVLKVEKHHEYEFAYSLDWQVRAVEKIAALFKDFISNINVRNITSNPVQISWSNTSLIDSFSTTCPKDELDDIAEVMLAGRGTAPSREAVRVFLPEFQLKKIYSQFFSPCEFHSYPHAHHETGHTHMETGGVAPIKNTPPLIRNALDHFEAAVGQLLRYKVPDDICYDMEDGNARNLNLKLMTIDLTTPSKFSWLQFDSANQEFFGLPLKEDEGRVEYVLECMDKGGMSVSDVLVVEVNDSPTADSPKPVLFSLSLDEDFKMFMGNAHAKARFLERLGKAFGDSRAEHLTIRSLSEGSVKVEWHNNSLPNHPCPFKEVQALRDIMMDENGRLRQEFIDSFLPDFSVMSGGSMMPSGSCLAPDTPTYPKEPDVAPSDEEEEASTANDDYLVSFVAPAAIIAAMLLVAALIACCLYRRRRYGKMSMTGDRTFVSKGIPIIFAEELDDHRPDSAKSPVIMKEEKPPLPPPEYQRCSPPRDSRRPPSSDMSAPPADDAPYHRPPPFTASNGGSRNQRPNLPPAYRKPPTYVPP